MSSYIFKTTPNGAKVKMTFGIGYDVSKQTLTLTRTRRHFPVLHIYISYKHLNYYSQFLFTESNGKPYLIIVYAIYTANPIHVASFYSIAVDDKMAAKLFLPQNKSSSSEHDSLTPCNMHLTPCNMKKILHGYSSAK